MKDLAHKKMLKEMKINESPITERIHVYLCNVDDPELIEAICKEDKNLHEATQYLYAKGSKLAVNGVADINDEMEREWTREYYLKEEVSKGDLKVLPPAKGERIEVVVEKIKEVEKVVYKQPTIEEIGEYLEQQSKKEAKKPKKQHQEALSLDL